MKIENDPREHLRRALDRCASLEQELAALKSRSCSGCRWYGKGSNPHWCREVENDLKEVVFWDGFDPTKDHCSRWEKKEEGDEAP